MKKNFNFVSPISIHPILVWLVLPFTIVAPAHAQSPAGDLQLDNIYTRFSHCIVNEYAEGSDSVRDQAKCRWLLIESNRKVPEVDENTKDGFTYFFQATLRKQDFMISYVTDRKNRIRYMIIGGDNFSFGGPAIGECKEYLRDSSNHIIVCTAQIIEDQLGNGASNNLVYAAAINLADMKTNPTNTGTSRSQSLPAHCTAAAIGSLLGLAITGNARASANAIPAECRQNSPSPQYQQPNLTNTEPNIKLPNTHLNPNRRWLEDSMRDTDRFIPNSDGWRDIERNPSGF
jgi:hypothetical protein